MKRIPGDTSLRRTLMLAMWTALIAGCGGGGGGESAQADVPPPASAPAPSPSPSPSPAPVAAPVSATAGTTEGLWKQVVNGERIQYALVEADGELWGIPETNTYSADAQSGEAIKGTITASSGVVSGAFSEVALAGCPAVAAQTCSVSGLSSTSMLSLNGAFLTQGVTLARWSFNGVPDTSYQTAASLAQFAGTWNLSAYIPGNKLASGALTISSTGSISATNVSGCAFSGSLVPVSGKGYFKISLTSIAGTCAAGVVPAQVRGVAFLAAVQNRAPDIVVLWHGADPTNSFWSSGSK